MRRRIRPVSLPDTAVLVVQAAQETIVRSVRGGSSPSGRSVEHSGGRAYLP
jgi:hypothetical protein